MVLPATVKILLVEKIAAVSSQKRVSKNAEAP